MSKYGRPSANTEDRPAFPEVAERIGEDPARYLHDPDDTAWARIRGIASKEVLDEWIAVEEELGPRRQVMKRLNARRKELKSQEEADD